MRLHLVLPKWLAVAGRGRLVSPQYPIGAAFYSSHRFAGTATKMPSFGPDRMELAQPPGAINFDENLPNDRSRARRSTVGSRFHQGYRSWDRRRCEATRSLEAERMTCPVCRLLPSCIAAGNPYRPQTRPKPPRRPRSAPAARAEAIRLSTSSPRAQPPTYLPTRGGRRNHLHDLLLRTGHPGPGPLG
jgi:hypothetical protein